MRVMWLMPNQWDQKSLRLRQAGLEFLEVRPWNDPVLVALNQQDGGLDGRKKGPQVEPGHHSQPMCQRMDRRFGILLEIVRPPFVNFRWKMDSVVVGQNLLMQWKSAYFTGNQSAKL